MSKLSPKQLRFCQEYVVDLNASAAAIRAGYAGRSAGVHASRMLKKANIKHKIKDLQKKISENLEITAEMVVKEFAKCGFSNIQNYISGGNTIRDLSNIPADHAAAVESVKHVENRVETKNGTFVTTTVTTKLHDKISALEKIGRHLGIFERDNKQKESRIVFDNDIPKRKPDGPKS